ncbi:MAG TPA: NfeD family protein [Candidatus Bathyarchaeia archaeon]|nr:NfeD family protein [Candidatus Bathyarchaeia archaeon]
MVKVSRQRIFLILLLAVVALTIQASFPVRVHAQSSVYVASLDQDIDPGAQDFVVSSINDATSSQIHSFILIINTNGGAGNNMEEIIKAISAYEGAGNTFTTLIAPGSAHAFSAGAFIAESSTNITMIPNTVIGSATPIVSGIPTGEENTTLTKDINAFTQYMISITPIYRNATATGSMVSHGNSFSCQAYTSCYAYQQHVVDKVLNVSTTQDALNAMGASGTEIHTAGSRSLFLSIISDPNLDSILFLAGVFAILADLYHPTLIFTVIGAAAIALALLGLGVFGAPLASIILMMIGAIFIFLELKTHHGVSAIAGVVIFIVGFLLIFSLPSSAPAPAGTPQGTLPGSIQIGILTYTVLGLIGGGGVLGSIYLYRVRETLMRRPPAQNPKAIIGKQGRLTSDLKAGGVATANIESEDFSVTATEDLPRDTLVKVKDLQGLKLVVERAEAQN